MANSFLRDMFELPMGEFRNRYGATVSGPDYARMKAAASGVSHATVLHMGMSTGTVSLDLEAFVVTRLLVKMYGSTTQLEVAVSPPLWQDMLLSAAGGHTGIDIRDVEWTPISIVLSVSDGSIYYEVHGYKPPKTNP